MHGTSLARRLRVSPNVEVRVGDAPVDVLLLHYTGMENADKACDWLCSASSKVSCHYLVSEEGQITQLVDEDLRAWHAGVSSWSGESDINSRSIGIEIQNKGHAADLPAFPDEQMKAVAALSRDIVRRHAILPSRVLAHSDVAPGRKIDPGERFDWHYLHLNEVGLWVEPAPLIDGAVLQLGDDGAQVAVCQSDLRRYGYGIAETGFFDAHTQKVVAAFQRHFRPVKVDGIADTSTVETLKKLLAAL